MKNPPLVLLQAIRKALKAKQATGDDVDAGHAHAGLYHDGFTGTIQPPIIPALNNQGGVGKQRWDTGVVDVVIPLYNFYAQGDNVVLYVDDVYVDDQTVRDTNVNLVFAAPIGAFNPSPTTPDYQADVHYHTIDQLGGNETASRATLLPVKLTVPGNPREDLPPGTVVNDRLAAPVGVPSEIIPLPGVDLPVLIPAYAYMHTGDIVTLSWAGASIVHPPLTADQVGKSLTFSVPYDILAARPGAAREVRYWVRDRVQNYSLFSPSVYSDVAEQATLIPPILIGQSGPGFDVDTLNGGPVLVLIPIADLLPGDRVKVHFTGQPVDWPYLHHVTEEQPFSGSSLTFSVPNPLAHSLVASTLNLYYQVQRGANALRSQSLILPLTGTALSLPAPQIPSAAGGEVAPPAGAIDIEIVAFANSAFTVGSVVEIVWRGIDGGGDEHLHSLAQPVVSAGAALLFRAPILWVDEIAGGALEVTYNLGVGGQTYTSQTLRHNVAGEASLLPVPGFDPALNELDQLDVDALTGAFHAVVNIDNPAFAGGTARLAWTGSSAADVIEISPIPSVPTTLRFPIDRARLIDPNLDQNVVVSYQILRADGRIARSRSVLLSVIDSASVPWPSPEVIDASGRTVTSLSPVHRLDSGAWLDNTATVVVRDRRLKAGDSVQVFWKLPNGDRPAIPVKVAQAGVARIAIPVAVLASSLNKLVSLTYLAIVDGVPASPAAESELHVLGIPITTLYPPVIIEATAETLDMNTFTADATLWGKRFPWMVIGQRYAWTLSSTLDTGTPWSTTVEGTVEPADLTNGVRRSLARRTLLQFMNGRHITITFSAWHSTPPDPQTINLSKTYTFKQLTLSLEPPLVEGLNAGEVVVLGTYGIQRVTARYLPEAGQQVQAIWAPTGLGPHVLPSQPRTMPASLDFDFPKSWLAQADGKKVDVSYQVSRTQGAEIQPSPVTTANVVWWPDPQLENWSTEPARTIPSLSTVEFAYFTATWRNDVSGKIGISAVPGAGWALTLTNQGTVTLTFKKPLTGFTISFLDAMPGETLRQIEYKLTNGERVVRDYRTPAIYSPTDVEPNKIGEIIVRSIPSIPLVIDSIRLVYF